MRRLENDPEAHPMTADLILTAMIICGLIAIVAIKLGSL